MSLYYDPRTLEVLRKQTEMSEETWHKIMNPFCGACMVERGNRALGTTVSNPPEVTDETLS